LNKHRDFSAAKNDRFSARINEIFDDLSKLNTRCIDYFPQTEFFINDTMNDFSICRFRHQDADSVRRLQTGTVEILFHGEAST